MGSLYVTKKEVEEAFKFYDIDPKLCQYLAEKFFDEIRWVRLTKENFEDEIIRVGKHISQEYYNKLFFIFSEEGIQDFKQNLGIF
jgi:hypothetical protein